ncbi:hypothetical protein AYI70_g12163 [Smittium culicis]|uniref:Uncharacterized protein n=1 Tax=Smittium culicis TaxID=133412 RepID=A0A1R1WYL6_9FUNG|nr:hypothetical protein AYI70_g12163 [Smittium culicis]
MKAMEQNELVKLDLKTPKEYLDEFNSGNIVLYPPQFYQITQMAKFHRWEDMAKAFSDSYDQHECGDSGRASKVVAMLPSFMKGNQPDQAIIKLPGDHEYNVGGASSKSNADVGSKAGQQNNIHRLVVFGKPGKFTSIKVEENIGAFMTINDTFSSKI